MTLFTVSNVERSEALFTEDEHQLNIVISIEIKKLLLYCVYIFTSGRLLDGIAKIIQSEKVGYLVLLQYYS